MSGFLTEENRAFLKDRHLSEYALSSLDRGNGVIFYPENINLMLDEARVPDPAIAAPDWQDISTAPRDGTVVILSAAGVVCVGHHRLQDCTMRPSEIARIVIAAAWGAALAGSIAMNGYAITVILAMVVILPMAVFIIRAAIGELDD
jgi:hypothetical protein